MNDIRPFRGLRFDEQVVGPIGEVVCPPYDVISPQQQIELYGCNPNNVVRLELGLEFPEDDVAGNRYTRAASTLQRWLVEGVLHRDATPALYLYEQEFPHDGKMVVRRGLLANLRLAHWEEGVVLPHEETLPKPKADRLELMRATECDLSPIFLLFDDPSGALSSMMARAARRPADVVADTKDGQLHRLWVLPATEHRDLLTALQPPQLYMADGHHRYETELAYRDERRAAESASRSTAPVGLGHEAQGVSYYDFGMMLLVDARDPGLIVLPTHRIVNGVDRETLRSLAAQLDGSFEIEGVTTEGLEPASVAEELQRRLRELGETGHAIGICLPGSAAILIPRPAVEAKVRKALSGRPLLDVDLLHEGLLKPLMGVGPEQLAAGSYLRYTRDAAEAVKSVENGSAQLAFLLNPTRVEQVMETARARGKMPQKSTYFYPKPATGLVINRL